MAVLGELRIAPIGAGGDPARLLDLREGVERRVPLTRPDEVPIGPAMLSEMLFVEAVLAQRRSTRPVRLRKIEQKRIGDEAIQHRRPPFSRARSTTANAGSPSSTGPIRNALT